MKISKFSRLAQRAKYLDIIYFSGSGTTWMSNGYGFYSTMSFPRISDVGEILTAFDITRKAAEDMHFGNLAYDSPDGLQDIDLDNYSSEEADAQVMQVVISVGDRILKAVKAAGQLIFFDGSLLGPIQDELTDDDGYIRHYVRRNAKGTPYIVIKNGTIAIAAIMPVKVLNSLFMDALKDFYGLCLTQADLEASRE